MKTCSRGGGLDAESTSSAAHRLEYEKQRYAHLHIILTQLQGKRRDATDEDDVYVPVRRCCCMVCAASAFCHGECSTFLSAGTVKV